MHGSCWDLDREEKRHYGVEPNGGALYGSHVVCVCVDLDSLQ